MPMRRGARVWLLAVTLAALAAGGVSAAASAEGRSAVAIVVSEAWEEARHIDVPTLRQFYLGRRRRWRGERVDCFHLGSGTPIREGFDRLVVGRTEAALEAYWIEQALLGGPRPPREFGSQARVLERVRQRAGNIGYVDHAALVREPAEGVRILGVLHDGRLIAPGDADYPIQYEVPTKP